MARANGKDIGSGAAPTLLGAARQTLGALGGVGVLSCGLNILALTGSLFMLEVYDRVIPSRSIATLEGLVLIAAFLYGTQGICEALRSRLLTRVGLRLDECLSPHVQTLVMAGAARTGGLVGLTPMRDLDQIRSFCSGPGLTALLDLPWVPFYLGLCFLFHPMIGVVALGGAAVLVLLALAAEFAIRGPSRRLAQATETRFNELEAMRRNAETILTLGMAPAMEGRWQQVNDGFTRQHRRIADAGSALATLSRTFRTMLQSGMLAVGALLVIEQQATGGIMMASSILLSRGLAPVELAIANWAALLNARRSWTRLGALLATMEADGDGLALPLPSKTLSVEGVSTTAPGGRDFVLRDVNFALKSGEALGIVGPSGSGKSSLVRVLVGAWAPVGGKVRLDGAELHQWGTSRLGQAMGYLPQEPELMDGTIAENIARFAATPDMEAVLRAAQAAGVHDMVVDLPDGYGTSVGERGRNLSIGQRQRIALARALYGEPFLIVLDEPNSNLDAEGEEALGHAILNARLRGAVVIVVAHRPQALKHVGRVLVLQKGAVAQLGDRDAVLGRLLAPARPMPQAAPMPQSNSVPQAAPASQHAAGPTLVAKAG